MQACLGRVLPEPKIAPERLHQAMRYAAQGGGKRVQPLLGFAAGDVSLAALRAQGVTPAGIRALITPLIPPVPLG